MSPKQPEQGFYIDVNEEDLRGASPGVLQFLYDLKDKKTKKTSRQDKQKTKTGFTTQQEASELIRVLAQTVQKLADQNAFQSIINNKEFCSLVAAVDVLRGQHPGNLDKSLLIGPPLVGRAKNEDSESGNALELPFDRDVVMVNLPKDTPEHGLDSQPESPTPKQLLLSVHDDGPIFGARQTQATLGTSSAPITVELLPAEDPFSTASLPDLPGSDLDVLKALVEYSVKYWPNKNFDHFLPGRFVPEWVLMELLRIDLPGQYTLGVPPNRISKLSKAWVGTVLPYHVNDVNQLSEIANEKNHFLIAIINTADKTFTSWGMSEAMERESKSAYEKALGFDLLGIRCELGDYVGNCCAFRCVEAIRSHFGIETTTRDEVHLRLFFLRRLLNYYIEAKNGAVQVQEPGEGVVTVPGPSQPISSSESRIKLTVDAPELVVRTVPRQAHAALTPAGDANPYESSRREDTNDSAGHVSSSSCSKLARTPLPNTPIKQTSAGETNRQPSSAQLDLDTSSTTLETNMPLRTPLCATGQTHTTKFPRKRSAEKSPVSTQSPEQDDIVTESAEPPQKRKDTEVPSLECLAKELTGSDATERIRRHVLAHNRHAPSLPTVSDEHEDWAKKTYEFLNLADQWEENSEFSRLVALIFRVHGVECIYIETRRVLRLDEEDSVLRLPKSIIDQVSPHLREKRTPGAFRRWLTLTRKLLELGDYLPFMPFGNNGRATFRHYERLVNEDIYQLRDLLKSDPRARGLARIGRAFRDCILKRQAFLWEDISSEKLSKLPDETLLHLLTTRRIANSASTKPASLSKQCDLCEGEICELSTLVDLASTLDDWDQLSSPDIIAKHYTNVATGLCQTWTSATSPSASTSLQAIDPNPSAMLVASVDNSTFLSQMSTYEAFWSADCTRVSHIGPQLQLALPRKVSDTAQSIEFAMKGNIDGLKNLFSLGLASPRDESHTRGYSLLRWAIYGGHLGIHNYEIIQFLVDHGADIDNKSYESVGYWNLRKKYSVENKKALVCIKRQDRNWFRERKFHRIHKIIFGISQTLLTDELLQNPNAIFATDAEGRTALDWATARAQLDDMRLLIAHGSNINSMDITGRTTLHTAVDSHNIEAFQMVLKAGAEPNPQMQGLRRGTPLTSASMNKHTEMVKMLIEHKAKIDGENPEGLTALHLAAITQNLKCAGILLEHGADMDYMSSNGHTPLMTAIMRNRHDVLRFFLGKRTEPLKGDQLLPVIAEHADSETMTILESSQFFDLSRDVDLAANREILLWRMDNSVNHAFEKLVSVCTGVAPPLSRTQNSC